MPFLPFVLLLVWQVIGRSASFALGWATALYFGQVPGKQGHVLALISLARRGLGPAARRLRVPLLVGAAADALGVVPRNFDLDRWIVLGLGAAAGADAATAGRAGHRVDLKEDRSLGRWLSRVPVSYPATASLGFGVLEMVAFTPLLIVDRLRHKRVLAQMALTMKEGTDATPCRRRWPPRCAPWAWTACGSRRPAASWPGRCARSASRSRTCSAQWSAALRSTWPRMT